MDHPGGPDRGPGFQTVIKTAVTHVAVGRNELPRNAPTAPREGSGNVVNAPSELALLLIQRLHCTPINYSCCTLFIIFIRAGYECNFNMPAHCAELCGDDCSVGGLGLEERRFCYVLLGLWSADIICSKK